MKSSRFAMAAVGLPLTFALSACGGDEANTRPDTGRTSSTGPSSSVTVTVPPAVGERMEQAGAVLDDASVTAKVKSALIADPDLSGLSIDVDTAQNVVTLNGAVSSDAAKQEAERIAKTVEGVKEVKNNLTVKQAG